MSHYKLDRTAIKEQTVEEAAYHAKHYSRPT
ncbi:MAG: hypothetical protein RLZZ429_2415 [Bacteroidota bacterium]|jgi:hypothetical protein